MKTQTKKPERKPWYQCSDEELHQRVTDYLTKFERLPKSKRTALLVKWDVLNSDGTLRRYPMDHVPLGPRN